ncbi:hypothetical protein FQR65_LT10846 [Abscondita terminalis]|nr:hypothetical protein FQR65_LT10846 [Abscondita terminalis]
MLVEKDRKLHPINCLCNKPSSPKSQSFNVGYSVRFNGKPQKNSHQTLHTPEIITGSRNEAVEKPISDFDAEEYVNNALIDIKKQKISGIKPKYNKYNIKDDSKHFIPHLAPKTQEYLSYLGQSTTNGRIYTRFRQHLPPKVVPTTESSTSMWTSLSPTIEIFHSKDLSHNNVKQSTRHFDHVGALGNSQGFDYSNVMEVLHNNHQGLYDHLETTEQTLHPFVENNKEAISYKPLNVLPVHLKTFSPNTF